MKIEGNRPNQEASTTQRLDGIKNGRSGQAATVGARQGDRVQLSPDAALAQSALQAAGETPAIRQDVVERARKALDAGQIGNDPERLADRLIDQMLGR
ncbi:MAG: flagellar biosynthesis anti-sigma factor FlgM [Vicinamibacterales bacterium]|nr:flagellar biosynthesis anti-sigma factor FlgM [Vicinamibacterales bacterium]